VYSLAIKPAIESGGAVGGYLQTLFPHLVNFVIIGAVVLTPIAVSLGLCHIKRTGALKTDASVSTEENPNIYKAVPGKEDQVYIPL